MKNKSHVAMAQIHAGYKSGFKISFILASIFLILGTMPFQQAKATALNFGIHHEYESPRAMAMGDAFTAVADDYSGLFYNPAGLGRRTDGQIDMYIDLRFNQDIFTLAKNLDSASKTTGTDQQKQEATLGVIKDVYGSNYGGRVSLPNGIWVRPNWGIAVIPADITLNAAVHKQFGPAINTTVYADTIVAFGMGKDVNWFSKGRTSAGFNVKALYRGYFNDVLDAPSLATNPNLIQAGQFREGLTADVDLGMLYDPEIPEEGFFSLLRFAKPTFGLVVRNVADWGYKEMSLYNKEKNSEAPEKLFRRIDIGTKWEYPSIWIFKGRGVMDFRDLLHPNLTARKALHLGFESDWTMFSWWKGGYRVGLNQGYVTAGLSALFAVFNLDLVTYGEDFGTTSVPIENRKFEVRLNIDI